MTQFQDYSNDKLIEKMRDNSKISNKNLNDDLNASNEKSIESLFENLLLKDNQSDIDAKMIYRVGDLVIDIKPPNYSQAADRAFLKLAYLRFEHQMESIVKTALNNMSMYAYRHNHERSRTARYVGYRKNKIFPKELAHLKEDHEDGMAYLDSQIRKGVQEAIQVDKLLMIGINSIVQDMEALLKNIIDSCTNGEMKTAMRDLMHEKITLAYEEIQSNAIDSIFEEEIHYQDRQSLFQKKLQAILERRAKARARRAQETAASENNLKDQAPKGTGLAVNGEDC